MKNFLFLALLGLTACGSADQKSSSVNEEWNWLNDPLNVSESYERNFANLALEGALEVTPWTDTYWPSFRGGLADRWTKTANTAHRYKVHRKRRIKRMNEDQLYKLSPAEKFDILRGRFNYPLTKSEKRRTSPDLEEWEGLCHGWAPAALLFDEPQPTYMTSDEGIEIPFASSDIKALLTYYQGQVADAQTRFLGARCDVNFKEYPEARNWPECRDTNAGAFHLVLANQLGDLKEGFVIDVTRDFEVWNQPVYAFSSKVVKKQAPSEGAAPGTVEEFVIESDVTYTVEVDAAWEALNETEGFDSNTETYRYRVELDESGEIIGGEWLSEQRPDFLWMQERAKFAGSFQKLQDLYEASIASE
jgi:hypothetical protein